MKNIKISRSYSAKIQLKQYEPIESFCAAEAEVEEAEMELASAALDKFVRGEVEKTLAGIVPEIPVGPQYITPMTTTTGPIPIFHSKKPSNLTPDQFGYVPKKGEKKIDLRGEPKSRDVGRDSAEHDTIQEID